MAVGIGDFQRAVRAQLGVPAGLVEAVVVAGAEQHEVRQFGRAALGHPHHVMTLAPHRGPVTAREATVLVADDQGAPQRRRDGAGGGA